MAKPILMVTNTMHTYTAAFIALAVRLLMGGTVRKQGPTASCMASCLYVQLRLPSTTGVATTLSMLHGYNQPTVTGSAAGHVLLALPACRATRRASVMVSLDTTSSSFLCVVVPSW